MSTDPISPDIGFAADQRADHTQLLQLDLIRRWHSGDQPCARHVRFAHGGDIVDLVPDAAEIDRVIRSDNHAGLLATVGDASVLILLWDGVARVAALGSTEPEALELAQQVRSRALDAEPDGRISVHVWHLDGRQTPSRNPKRLTAPSWEDIAGNYPMHTRTVLDSLIALERPTARGRLLLWHGPPGTGKTTAIRALMKAWEPWCQASYVADPERLFNQPHYLAQLIGAGDFEPADRWRLIIAEDTDDYLRTTARRTSGASMGRLLNLADGILGQGANAIVLLTTNEPLATLHPAVTRPGRCLAVVEFPTFTPAEARAWLGSDAGAMPGRPTLADLLVRRGDLGSVAGDTSQPDSVGAYL